MKLSILIISYNQRQYLDKCLDSIFFQDIPFDYEIIVADDFSTDGSLAYIQKKLSEKGISFTVLEDEKNLGIAKNCQRGFYACKGEYIAVIEGDDYWVNSQRLKKHIGFLDTHNECVMTFNRLIYYFEEESRFYVSKWEGNDNIEYYTTAKLAEGNRIVNLSSCVLRNSIVKKLDNRIYNTKIGDWLIGMSMGMHGLLVKLKDPMSVYKVSSSGIWSKMNSIEKQIKMIELIDLYNDFFDYKFDKEFKKNKQRSLDIIKANNKGFNIRAFIPPIAIILLKSIIPPILRERKR
jgi:glycosyltransferase involved in cell wall biosynthesis